MIDLTETLDRLERFNYEDAPADAVRQLVAQMRERDAEITRLRNGGCARDQRTTQFCAEAARIANEKDARIAQLERDLANVSKERDEACGVVQDLSEQIIEARKMREALEIQTGKPWAWAAWTPHGEYDYLVFPYEQDALDEAHNQSDLSECEAPEPAVAIPLYPAAAALAALNPSASPDASKREGEASNG